MSYHIIVADRDPFVCDRIASFFHKESDYCFVDTFHNAPDSLDGIASREPDLVLVNLEMLGEESLPSLKSICSNGERTSVIFLVERETVDASQKALDMGASAVFARDADLSILRFKVKQINAGKKPFVLDAGIEPRQRPYKHRNQNKSVTPEAEFKPFGLSEEQMRIVVFTAMGYSNLDIAREVDLSVPSVKNYKRRILATLGLKGKGSLGYWAKENKILELAASKSEVNTGGGG